MLMMTLKDIKKNIVDSVAKSIAEGKTIGDFIPDDRLRLDEFTMAITISVDGPRDKRWLKSRVCVNMNGFHSLGKYMECASDEHTSIKEESYVLFSVLHEKWTQAIDDNAVDCIVDLSDKIISEILYTKDYKDLFILSKDTKRKIRRNISKRDTRYSIHVSVPLDVREDVLTAYVVKESDKKYIEELLK